VAIYDNKKFAVEVELSLKSSARLRKIIEDYVKLLNKGEFHGILYFSSRRRVAEVLQTTIRAVAGVQAIRFSIGDLKP
jgi:hypothetical protein